MLISVSGSLIAHPDVKVSWRCVKLQVWFWSTLNVCTLPHTLISVRGIQAVLFTSQLRASILHTSKGGGNGHSSHVCTPNSTKLNYPYPEVDCSAGVAIPFVPVSLPGRGVCSSDECSVVGSRGDPITGSPITYRSTSLSVIMPTSLPCVGPVPPSTTTSRCTRCCRRSARSLPSESYCVHVITPGKSRDRWESADWIV